MKKVLLIPTVTSLFLFAACGKANAPATAPASLDSELQSDLQNNEATFESKDAPNNGGKDFKTFGDTINRIFYSSNEKDGSVLHFSYWNYDAATDASPAPVLTFETLTLTNGTLTPAMEGVANSLIQSTSISGTLTCAGADAKKACKTGSIKLTKSSGKFSGDAVADITEVTPSAIATKENTSVSATADDAPTLDILHAIALDTMKSNLQTIQIEGEKNANYRLKVQFKQQAANAATETAFDTKTLYIAGDANTPTGFRMGYGTRIANPPAGTANGVMHLGVSLGMIDDTTTANTLDFVFAGGHRLSDIIVSLTPPVATK